MRRKTIALLLIVAFAAPNVVAADLRTSIEKAAAAEAARMQPASTNQIWGMSPSYFWWGTALTGTGALGALYAMALKSDACEGWDDAFWGTSCPDAGFDATILYYLAVAGGGVAVWMVGKNKGRAAYGQTMFQPRPGGFAVTQRIRF